MISFLIGLLIYSLLAGVYYCISSLVFEEENYDYYNSPRLYNIWTSVFFPIFMWVLIAKVGGKFIFDYIKRLINK